MKKLFDVRFLKKHIAAVVALIMIFAFAMVSVFAWTETISSLKIMTVKDGIVDSGINTAANINDTDTAINLDSYFSESGNVHLASCSSPDGKNFYFPIKAKANSSAPQYRKSNLNDKNVNYISFSLKLKADGADRQFYFRQNPTIKIGGTTVANTNTSVRMAFYLDDESKGIFANSRVENASPVNSTDGSTTTVNVNSISDYTIGKTSIFRVAKNTTATLTISLWLEDPACKISSGVVSVEGFELITEAQQTTRYTFADCTSAFNAPNDADHNSWLWVKNDGAIMWISDGSKSYKMTKVTNTNIWTADVMDKSYTTNTDIIFYRTASTVTDPVAAETADGEKTVYNKWTTKYQTDKKTYSAFGTADANGNGKGTWDELNLIRLQPESTVKAAADVLPVPSADETHKAAHIKAVYKDGSSNVTIDMCYNGNFWKCYIPSTVTQLSFLHDDTDTAAAVSTLDQSSLTIAEVSNKTATYTVTGAKTGYWGTGVLVKANVADNCKNFGTADVKVGTNSVNGLKVTKGTKVTFTATANTGYQFKNWTIGSTTNTNSTIKDVTANSDLTYVANFVKLYTVTAHAATGGTVQLKTGGTAAATAKYTAGSGTSVTLSNVFTANPNDEYEFDGWYTSAAGGTEITSAFSLTSDRDVYARFKKVKYTITAHATTGGTVSPTTYTAESGTSVTISSVFTAKANANYTFDGWYTAETGGTKIENPITLTGNMNVYARFKKSTFTITAHATAGGTVSPSTYTANNGATVTLSNVFTATPNTNYTFDGWYTAETGGEKITTVFANADKNVYARFTVKTRTVYLTNNYSWSNLSCYAWEKSSGANNGTFPGAAMTWDSKNDYKQDVYKIVLPYTYDHVIFSNGTNSTKTVDITLPDTGDVKYYISGGSGSSHEVKTW